MNQWVSVKGCILGLWTDGLHVVITISVETLDGLWLYCYIGFMLGKPPRTKETLSGYQKSIGIPWVDALTTGPPGFWGVIAWY